MAKETINIIGMKKNLSYENIVTTISKVCQKYGIKLVLNDPDVGKDNGYAFDTNEIHLGNKYTSNLIMLAIALHEFGHTIIARRHSKKYRKLSIFREETLAWTLAMELQQKYFGKSFTKSQGNFMLDCLKTYSKQHYHFSKSYDQEDNEDEKEARKEYPFS